MEYKKTISIIIVNLIVWTFFLLGYWYGMSKSNFTFWVIFTILLIIINILFGG